MSTEPRPWEVIRAAADRLEELAGKATPWPWRDDAGDGYVTAEWSDGDETTWETVADTTAANGAWIATLSPAVAEPLVASCPAHGPRSPAGPQPTRSRSRRCSGFATGGCSAAGWSTAN